MFGFKVYVDATWLLLAALISWSLADSVYPDLIPGQTAATYWSMGIASAVGILFSIVFHEMSHSLVARRFGMPITGITLFIFGGVAEMEDEPTSARGEFLMAIAGPIASAVLAGALFLVGAFLSRAGEITPAATLFGYLALMNFVLALFNLVPGFPLDGGRVLRAALWSWSGDIVWATRIAAGAGNAFGLTLLLWGIWGVVTGDVIGGLWRFLIGSFLRNAAAASFQQVTMRQVLSGMPVRAVMSAPPITVEPGQSIAGLIEAYVYRYHHSSFPVVRQGRLVGEAGIPQAAAINRSLWPDTQVGQVATPVDPGDIVAPDTDVLAALERMRRRDRGRLFVVEDGALVGVVSLRDLIDYLTVRRELESQTRRAA